MTFGQKLRYLRKEKDLTQEELSKLIKVSRAAIGRYENDERTPDYETLKGFADFFNVSVDYLLGRTNIRKTQTEPFKIGTEFTDATQALKFILEQPVLMAYGGYDLEKMTDEELIDLANDILLTIRISTERRKNK